MIWATSRVPSYDSSSWMKNAQIPTTTELHQIVIKKRVAVFELLKIMCQHLQMILYDEPVF